jgi:hypothetical protein
MNLPTESLIDCVLHYLYKQDYSTDNGNIFSVYFYAVDDIHAQCVLEDIKTSESKPERIYSFVKG